MGFRDSENPLKIYRVFMCGLIFPGRSQSSQSHQSYEIPKGTMLRNSCIDHLI